MSYMKIEFQEQQERDNESGMNDFMQWMHELETNPSYAAAEVRRIARVLEIERALKVDRNNLKPF